MKDHNQLIDAYLDGTLTSEEETLLQTVLRDHAEARATLRRRAAMDEHLSYLAQDAPLPAHALTKTASPSLARWPVILPWALAATLMMALIFSRPGAGPKQDLSRFVALLVNEANAQFAPEKGPDEVRFEPGDYLLTKGAVHLRFENGADVVMKAPASFRIDDSLHLALEDGGLRAIIPPTAQGFTVATPGLDYEDLGTEFGVSVNQSSGESQLHVFDGQVDAKRPDSDELLSSVFAGETLDHIDGNLISGVNPRLEAYPQPGEIGFLRWQNWKEQLVKDPSLIAFYSFTKNNQDPNLLQNQIASGRVSDGEIQQARWVSGRWPGKEALLFDRQNNRDAVSLNFSGTFDELSISTWIKVNRLDHELTSLLDSNGWDEGAMHFQIGRSGHIRNGFFSLPTKTDNEPARPIDMGKWRHVVSLVSQPQGISKVYIDGQLAHSAEIREPGLLAPGPALLGNWLRRPDWKQAPIRAFKGRIDELAIWNRALSENEIKATYEAGRPNLIDD